MAKPVRVAHYINQFFAGIGGEEQANIGLTVRGEAVGPGRAIEQAMGPEGKIVATLVCGDNAFSERTPQLRAEVSARLSEIRPDVVVSGPAFGSGRYGLACAEVCRVAKSLGIPAVTAMHAENPGALQRGDLIIVPAGESAASMAPAAAKLAQLALRLGRQEAIGSSEAEGILPRGVRIVFDRKRPGYQRALEMLLAKLNGTPFVSEVPYRAPERVPPAPPLRDLSQARIGLVTTGGLVRKGNPEKQVAANATRFHRHSVAELESLSPADWEAYHAGYFNHIVNSNPNYILPLSFLRDLERQKRIGAVYEHVFALPGVSTPVHIAAQLGKSIADELKSGGVDGALLVAT